MNPWLKNGLQIFGLNILAVGLSIAAIFAFYLLGDPFLAAIPAAWALPILLLQPWVLIFWFTKSSSPVILIGLTLISIAFYGLVVRWHRVEKWKAQIFKKLLSAWVSCLSLLVAVSLIIGVGRWFDFPAINTVIPNIYGTDLAELSLDPATSRVARLGGFIDSELVWQIVVTEAEFRTIATQLRLDLLDSSEIADEFLKQRPYWWNPTPEKGTLVYATPNFPLKGRGPDGNQIFTTWDPSTGKLHAWLKLNF